MPLPPSRPRRRASRNSSFDLLRSLEKPTDGLASRYLHRAISREITRIVLPWRVTPNAMTIVAALFGFLGVAIAYRGGYGNLLAGAALMFRSRERSYGHAATPAPTPV